MKKNSIILSLIISSFTYAQVYADKVGINTPTPNSTLAINGSLQTQYKEVTTAYTLTNKDHYISYTGTSNVIFTLPTIESGNLSFAGRIYRIKNISNNSLTIQPSNGNFIRNTTTNGIGTVVIPAGYYIEIINNKNSTNLPSAPTWDLSFLGASDVVNSSADATRFLGGTVYVKFIQTTGGTLNVNNRINGSYSVGINNPNITPSVGGINSIIGGGYKISNPSAGIFDIQFINPFTQIYGVSVNLLDSYGSAADIVVGQNPTPAEAGSRLKSTDNTQVSFQNNNIIRIKTGDQYGNYSNRPFTFMVVGN